MTFDNLVSMLFRIYCLSLCEQAIIINKFYNRQRSLFGLGGQYY